MIQLYGDHPYVYSGPRPLPLVSSSLNFRGDKLPGFPFRVNKKKVPVP